MDRLKVRVDAERISPLPCSRLILGNFIELGLGRQVSGMWAEMVYNRSFRTVPPVKPIVWEWLRLDAAHYDERAPFWHSGYEEMDWEPISRKGMEMARTHGFEPFKGSDSLGVRNLRAGAVAGIRQKGIFMRKGRGYRLELFAGFKGRKVTVPPEAFDVARDPQPETREVIVSLRPERGPGAATAPEPVRLSFPVNSTQQPFDGSFTWTGPDGRAVLEISFSWEGTLHLSACSLMPEDNQQGWRADVIELLRRISPPIIRFPGGCFASFYDWKDGIGPRDLRCPREPYFWGGLEENDVGIDELLALCDMLGSEPQVCVNMMTGSPRAAAELVEYCNGRDDSALGRLRVSFGVKRNRRVRFWEMENEANRKWSAAQYAAKVGEFARAMRAVDPDITIMMEYYSWGIEALPRMLEIAGKDVDVVIHRDADRPFLGKALAALRTYNAAHGTSIRQANTEWLPDFNAVEPFRDRAVPQHYDWEESDNDYRKVLSYREIRWFYALNAASRIIDYVSCGGELALANFNNCVNTWGQNVIEASKEGAWLSPAGRVFELFRSFDGGWPIATSWEPADLPAVNMQAVETGDDALDFYAVNRGSTPFELDVSAPPGRVLRVARSLEADDVLATNRLGEDRIRLRELDPRGSLTLAPLSVMHARFAKG